MASRLTNANIIGQQRIRLAAVKGVEQLWQGLSGYDEGNLTEWLAAVLPHVSGAQRASISLTSAFLARSLEVPDLGIDSQKVIDSLRGETTPKEVYTRPFITVWGMLGEHRLWQEAHDAGKARAMATAAMDVQMAMRATCQAVQGVYGG